MRRWSFGPETLSADYLEWHESARAQCRREIVQMTHLADSGHPGGSLSSLDVYLVLYSHANLDPQNPWARERDRIVVSHGHTSPGVYSVLARLGYFPPEDVIAHFRRTSHVFEGHIEREAPGVEWTTGNLGQGLSAAAGMALGLRLRGIAARVFVPMGDGEQQKGQIAEARRFIAKYALHNVTVIIDRNRLQIGGETAKIMPQRIEDGWRADGWHTVEIDGHDPVAIYRALRSAAGDAAQPHAIIANSVMGKGVSFMENKADFHGRGPKPDEYARAAKESGEDPALWNLEPYRARAAAGAKRPLPKPPNEYPRIVPGEPRTYAGDTKTDNRSAFGAALADVAKANARGTFTPIAVFDCDLEGSVKTEAFHAAFPAHFFEAGIQEHHTAACAGALSIEGIASVFADFGVFGICETYNQHRLTDINHGHLKLVCTHIGLDVGEDGKTHQCIDYVGVLRNIFGMRIIVPADPNQTDRALRYLLAEPGMFFLGMGRSKLPVITAEDGSPYFAGGYRFEPGRGDWIRRGAQGIVVAMGTVTGRAFQAVSALAKEGLALGLAHLAMPAEPTADFIDEIARAPLLVTVEDHSVRTGLGECLAAALFARGHALPHLRLGVERYAPSGGANSVFLSQRLDAESIQERIRDFACARTR
ncbi:MAG: transketolase [Planctomycetes bacterium]|nr:transketolase [Planctomycetota bacterium]